MNLSSSISHKVLRRVATDDAYQPSEAIKSEMNIKKASTFPNILPLDMQLYSLNKETIDTNPFLKARVKAYLNDLDKSSGNLKLKKEESAKDTQAPLFQEERVTLKKINETRISLNMNTAQELKKKIVDEKARLIKN